MKNTGTLRIQAFAARQSSPVEGVTVTVSGNGFTATRLTDAEGNADDVTLTTPACALSLDENNTTQPPYAVCDLVASKPGYRTVRIQGVQVFPGQVTLAQPEMIPDTEEMRDTPNVPSSPATAAAARPPPSPVCRGCWTGSSSRRTSPSTSASPPPRPGTSPSRSAAISPTWRPVRCIRPGLTKTAQRGSRTVCRLRNSIRSLFFVLR